MSLAATAGRAPGEEGNEGDFEGGGDVLLRPPEGRWVQAAVSDRLLRTSGDEVAEADFGGHRARQLYAELGCVVAIHVSIQDLIVRIEMERPGFQFTGGPPAPSEYLFCAKAWSPATCVLASMAARSITSSPAPLKLIISSGSVTEESVTSK